MDCHSNSLLSILAALALCVSGCSSESPAELPEAQAETPTMDAEVMTVALDGEEQGNPAAAIETYTRVIEEQPRAVDARFARGQVHQSLGNHAAAEADFNAVLRQKPRHAAAYFSRGQTLQAQGKHHQALVSYSLAIAVEPRQAKWYYLRGKAYEALADEADASNEAGRANELRGRAAKNRAIAAKLDPITDFELHSQFDRSQ
ncbi:MAG: tetratricopeptide repeat protein [Pirellulales bacterium]|nr:tetratricopeptide repeat protein [Pirellulales bacterium]